MSEFSPCPTCARHVRGSERVCPFCASALPMRATEGETGSTSRLSRRALLLAVGAGLAACRDPTPAAVYGAPPPRVSPPPPDPVNAPVYGGPPPVDPTPPPATPDASATPTPTADDAGAVTDDAGSPRHASTRHARRAPEEPRVRAVPAYGIPPRREP